MITSYEKDKLEVGKVYWTYYNRLNKKRNGFNGRTGVFSAKFTIPYPDKKDYETFYKWEIVSGGTFSHTMKRNIGAYLRGNGYCRFSESYDECVKDHDEAVLRCAENEDLTTDERDRFFKKLIQASRPEKAELEVDSLEWYNKLSEAEQGYVKWIKFHCSDIK
jgi:hypothetical protein